jgi:protein-L-isoaspartate(D-aspartate) O-methyltransferase
MREAAALVDLLRPAIGDQRVLDAIAATPRELFVPPEHRRRAYMNEALPIACGQTISQPLVVGRMLELLELKPSDRVLDVGTGSGYHASLLSLLVDRVWTIERIGELSLGAERAIAELGLRNVEFVVGDGWEGLASEAPFDAINVAAASWDAVPAALEAQLAVGGRLVAPVGGASQHLIRVRRTESGFERATHEAVRFVPLVRGGMGG